MHKILLTLFTLVSIFSTADCAERSNIFSGNPGQEIQSVYPNPFLNTIFVKLGSIPTSQIHIRVFDILGNEVYSNILEFDKLTKVVQLDLDQEKVSKRGVYMVKVEVDGQTTLYRLFKD